METYSVLLFRFRGGSEVMYSGLSLEEAQEICEDPETSSRTSSDPDRYGSNPWFFGYTAE